jgi:putative transposase
MKRSRFSTDQIIGILREQEAGANPLDLARKHGVSRDTIYRWKAKYGGMDVSDARRLEELEDENRRLKHVVADLTLDNQALKKVITFSGGSAFFLSTPTWFDRHGRVHWRPVPVHGPRPDPPGPFSTPPTPER